MLFSLSNLKRRFAIVPMLLLGLMALLLFDRHRRELIWHRGPVLRPKQPETMRTPSQMEAYVLTERRDEETINRFLDEYVDRDASEDREGEELMMEPLDSAGVSRLASSREEYDSEPALTMTHALQRGLDYPRRAFALYVKTKSSEYNGAVLCFTTVNQRVLGVFLGDTPDEEHQARELLQTLMNDYDGVLGMISIFEPPPGSEAEFRDAKGKPLVLHFIERPTS